MRLWPLMSFTSLWIVRWVTRAAFLANLLVVAVDHMFFSDDLISEPLAVWTATITLYVCFRMLTPARMLVVRLNRDGMELSAWVTLSGKVLRTVGKWILLARGLYDDATMRVDRMTPWTDVQLVTILHGRRILLAVLDLDGNGNKVFEFPFLSSQQRRLERVLTEYASQVYVRNPWWNDARRSVRHGGNVAKLAEDRFPARFFYLSDRLLRDLYNSLEISHPKWRAELLELTFPSVAKVQIKPQNRPTPENLAWVARKVTPAMSDEIGSVLYPGAEYIIAYDLDMVWCALPQGPDKRQIAWFYSFSETEEGPVFVALCGSVGNYLDYHESSADWSGWYPSSMQGMSEVVAALADKDEDYDAIKEAAEKVYLDAPSRYSGEIPTLVQESFEVSKAVNEEMRRRRLPSSDSGPCTILFKRFAYERDVRIGGVDLRAAIVGAPVWVGRGRAHPLPRFGD